jgi:ribosome-binding factor A
VAQERLAERLQRAISTMYSTEVMPSQWVTLNHLQIRGVKVSRNLRKCQVLYEPSSTIKKERGNVHRALQDYTHLLNSMIRTHAHLKRPLSIKFVPDTQAKELEDIFNKISAEEQVYSVQN